MIQAFAAVPQLRQVLAAIDWKTDDPTGDLRKTEGHELEIIQELFKLQDTEKVTYEVIDPALDLFQPNYTNPNTSTVYANITGMAEDLVSLQLTRRRMAPRTSEGAGASGAQPRAVNRLQERCRQRLAARTRPVSCFAPLELTSDSSLHHYTSIQTSRTRM